jgi:uracil-DNA glycosylase family 4
MPAVPGRELAVLQEKIVRCRRCPRLIEYCREIARQKRRAYLDWDYWGRPVPSFGDPAARVLVIGLAPGAHGSNRTGRMFTGDASGNLLYRVLYSTGFASAPTSLSRQDGLVLKDLYITAAVRCAPPGNKPAPGELANCRPYLKEELRLLRNVRVVVSLGKLAHDVYLGILQSGGAIARRSLYPFGHGLGYQLPNGLPLLLASYHPSQQNTSTGKLTEAMLRAIFQRAREALAGPGSGASTDPAAPPVLEPLP